MVSFPYIFHMSDREFSRAFHSEFSRYFLGHLTVNQIKIKKCLLSSSAVSFVSKIQRLIYTELQFCLLCMYGCETWSRDKWVTVTTPWRVLR
jgi:hypothetical protein